MGRSVSGPAPATKDGPVITGPTSEEARNGVPPPAAPCKKEPKSRTAALPPQAVPALCSLTAGGFSGAAAGASKRASAARQAGKQVGEQQRPTWRCTSTPRIPSKREGSSIKASGGRADAPAQAEFPAFAPRPSQESPARADSSEPLPAGGGGLWAPGRDGTSPAAGGAWLLRAGRASERARGPACQAAREVSCPRFPEVLSHWAGSEEMKPPVAYQKGEEMLTALLHATSRGIALRIAVNPPSARMPCTDLQLLGKSGAEIRQVDLPRLTRGVLHTKFWIVDQLHIYLGSANMDWRALTQVKELGAAVYNCSCLAQDLGKMFEVYWTLGLPNTTIPSPWPANYSTTYNKETPLELKLNGTEAAVYFSSAPPALCATGRTEDLQSLLSVIEGAQEFVYVAVMSYLPTMEFSHPRRFWPAIDDHFRKVAYEKRVRLRLLVGCWRHSKPDMFPFLRSLAALQDNRTHYSLEVRLFVVPANETQAKIPYGRVNHSKFMVTDKVAYIGTSNWSGDYFLHTAGSALVVAQGPGGERPSLREQLQRVFERDWNSRYSRELDPQGRWEALCGLR